MSGKKPPGRPIGSRASDLARSKIQTTKLIVRLQNHAFGKLKNPMTPDQIQAAQFLLRQNLAPLQPVDPNSYDAEQRTVVEIIDATHKDSK